MANTPPGLILNEDFLTEKEEAYLIRKIDECEWLDNRNKTRKVQIYGPYHDSKYKIIPGKFSEHPKWVKKLAKKIWVSTDDPNRDKLLNPETCEVYTNEYKDFAELQYHFDHRSIYDENIYGVSLNSDGFLGFKHNMTHFKVPTKRRSLYVMTGESRNKYKHGIDRGWINGRRLSVTFRTIRS